MQAPYRQAERVAKVLDGRTLVCAESCTAGLLTQALAAQEGSGEWLRGGVVAYQAEVQRALLGVEAENIFSVDAAEQMATGVAKLLSAQVAVAATGVAGPEPESGVEPGAVVVAWVIDGAVGSTQLHLDGDPPHVCHSAAGAALDLLVAALRAADAKKPAAAPGRSRRPR